MKKLVLSYLALFLMMASVSAQPDYSKEVAAKVAEFEFMIGTWSGTGQLINPDGSTSSTDVLEEISYKLGNTIIQMEGLGTRALKNGETEITHEALGILSYDFFQRKYKLSSFIGKGMQTVAEIEIRGGSSAVWWFNAGPAMTIRYTLKVENGKWNEIGERSTDGENWVKFFEMNLEKLQEG